MRAMVAVWLAACICTGIAAARAVDRSKPDAAGAPVGVIEDRRLHHFRNATYTETQRWFNLLLERAGRATDSVTRARALAALSSLQRERGMQNQATAAAEQALRLAPTDPEVQRLLAQPLDVRALDLAP